MTSLHKQIESILCCPFCQGKLQFSEKQSSCAQCAKQFPIKQGQYYFREVDAQKEVCDFTDCIKFIVKKYPKLYYWIKDILSPIYPNPRLKKWLKSSQGIKANIGSGNTQLSEDIINIDMFDYSNVHIVCDVQSLPLRNNSLDVAVNISVLEHVPQPTEVLKQIHRCLKPQGKIFTSAPFLEPFHASPYDFRRFSQQGLKQIHENFQEEEVGIIAGPFSAFCWFMQEWLAFVFCFGSRRLRAGLSLFLMLLTWPIKFLDAFCLDWQVSENLAAEHYFIGQKA